MYDLRLSVEQLEIRDTVRGFVERELKLAALHPDRLERFERPLLLPILDKASHIGLRTLALSEAAGGAGADRLTACIVFEELGAGDADVAVTLAHTSGLGHVLFDQRMTAEQRRRFLPGFVQDHRYHLAFAGPDPVAGAPAAVKHRDDDWVISGRVPFVANAPLAKLFAVQVRTEAASRTLLVPRDTPGLTVGEPRRAVGETDADGEPVVRWHHGAGSAVTFEGCQVSSTLLLGEEGPETGWIGLLLAAINLGVGRAAYETALDYAKVRRQGGRNIIEHQAIGAMLADSAIKLEVARTMIWKAAWVADHPEAVADRSVCDLPLPAVARLFTAEAVHEVTLRAAECFGAMGVMRDMPLAKYVQDGLVFLHSEPSDRARRLRIAEVVAGYRDSVGMAGS